MNINCTFQAEWHRPSSHRPVDHRLWQRQAAHHQHQAGRWEKLSKLRRMRRKKHTLQDTLQVIAENADIFVYKNVQNTCLCFICFLCDWIGFISRPRSSKYVGTCFISEISWNQQEKNAGHCKAQCRTGSNQQQGTAGSHIITTSPCGQKETAWNSSVYTKKLKHCVFGETR